jgi:hypothetical protein
MQGRASAARRAISLALVAGLLAAAPAAADTFNVTTTADGGGTCPDSQLPCTLRTALAEAANSNGPDTINVPAGNYVLSAQFGQLNVTKTALDIVGASARTTTIQAAAGARAMAVDGAVTGTISHLTITGGTATAGVGGNIASTSPNLTLDHVRLTLGTAVTGGGIANTGGTLTIRSSLIDHNNAVMPPTGGLADGGGVASVGTTDTAAPSLTVQDSTIASNTAPAGGGIIVRSPLATTTRLGRVTVAYNNGAGIVTSGNGVATVRAHGSVFAGNTALVGAAGPMPRNCGAPLTTDGSNVDSATTCGFTRTDDRQNANAGLAAALTVDGGETPVLPLSETSAALDLLPCASPAGTDQRDLARPQGPACDAGAYERFVPVVVQPQPTSQPTPTATPTPTPSPQPKFHSIVVIGPVSGKVLVKKPGSTQFVPVDMTQGIPLGSTVDARKGHVRVTSVPKAGGTPETAEFWGGIFKITQSGSITQLQLVEQLAACSSRAASAAAKKPKTRKLWGNGSGSFRTRGQYSAATVRGTKWLVQDSCAGTLTRVTKGVVSVRDYVKRKTIIVRAGKRYLARPKR